MNYSNITERRVLCYGDSNTYGYDPARPSAIPACCKPCLAASGP